MIDGLRGRVAPPPPPPAPKQATPAPAANKALGFSAKSLFEAPAKALMTLTTPVAAAAPAPPTDVEQAASAVDAAYASGGARAAAAELRAQSEALNDPAKVDALMTQSKATIDRISADLANGAVNNSIDQDTNRDVLRDLDTAMNRAGPSGKEVVASSLATQLTAAVPEGSDQMWQFDDALDELAEDGVGATLSSAVAEKLINGGRIEAGNALLNASTEAVNAVRSDYDEKAGKLGQVEARLNAELSQLGPALTPAEVDQYKQTFWARPENAQIRDEAHTAGDRLSQTMAATSSHLEQLASQGDEDSKTALFDAYHSLAGTTNHADESIRFAGRINQNEGLANALRAQYGDGFEQKLADEILAPAMPNAQAEAIAEAGEGGFDAAMAKFDELVGDLETAKTLKDIPGSVKQMVDDVRSIHAGTYSPDKVGELLGSWGDKSAFSKSLSVATFGLGLYDLPSQLADGEYLSAIQNVLTSTSSGIELTAGVLNTLGKVSAATDVAKFGAKFLPVLGLGADAIQAYQDIEALQDGVSAGDVFNLAGTVVSLVGDVAGYVPIAGTAVDVVTTVVGEVLHVIGDLFNGDFGPGLDSFDLGEVNDILHQNLGLSEAQVQLLVTSTQQGYGERLSKLGMSPEQVRGLLTQTDPPLFAYSGGLGDYQMLGNPNTMFDTLAAFGVTGTAAVDFLQKFNGASSYFDSMMALAGGEASLGNALASGDFSAFREFALQQLPEDVANALRSFDGYAPNQAYFRE